MSEPIKKKIKVEVAQNTPEKENEPKEKVPEKELPIWNFPLQQKSVRAKTLKEAQEKIVKE